MTERGPNSDRMIIWLAIIAVAMFAYALADIQHKRFLESKAFQQSSEEYEEAHE